jgi:hypothetical protein
MPSESCYPEKAPAVDQLLETLCHAVRREIIHYFENVSESETASLTELTARLTSRIPSATDESVRVGLRHVHLPKLSRRGWLDYDSDADHVEYHGNGDARPLLGEVRAVF